MSEAIRPAPWWLNLAARVVRRLPAARYVTMNALCRLPLKPFVGRMGDLRSGPRFECDVRNGLAREAFFLGHYEPQETCVVRALLGPGQTFFDVGANTGYFSLLAAERVGPTGRVVAVEADPRIFPLLERNVALNGLSQVTLVAAAAGAGPGTVKLAGFDESQPNWGISRVVESSEGPYFEVPARAVDDVADELGLSTIHLLKMDIEGAETFALQGMARGLAAHRYQRILLELHPLQLKEHGTDTAAVCAKLTAAGYTGWRIRHSMADTRRAAYAKKLEPADVLEPLREGDSMDAWPHVLWLAPGVAPPVPAAS